jgi:hypothetical protein
MTSLANVEPSFSAEALPPPLTDRLPDDSSIDLEALTALIKDTARLLNQDLGAAQDCLARMKPLLIGSAKDGNMKTDTSKEKDIDCG